MDQDFRNTYSAPRRSAPQEKQYDPDHHHCCACTALLLLCAFGRCGRGHVAVRRPAFWDNLAPTASFNRLIRRQFKSASKRASASNDRTLAGFNIIFSINKPPIPLGYYSILHSQQRSRYAAVLETGLLEQNLNSFVWIEAYAELFAWLQEAAGAKENRIGRLPRQ